MTEAVTEHPDGCTTHTFDDGAYETRDRHGRLHDHAGHPSSMTAAGTRFWALHGVGHRSDGPACERPDGSAEWRLHGQAHTPEAVIRDWVGATHPDAPPAMATLLIAAATPWPYGATLDQLYAAAAAAAN